MAINIGQIIRFMTVRATEGLIVLLLIMFMPNIPPFCKISDSIPVAPSKPLEGKLKLNERLNDIVIWHKGDLDGPESFADYNGVLYTSLANGHIVKLVNDQIVSVVKFGKPCKGFYQEKICGRPLGIKFDKDGSLIAADAYYGIYRVDVTTGDKIQLVSPDVEIEEKKPKIPNSVAIASNGDIYWSDSSTDFYLEDGLIDLFADGSGRLIHYNVTSKSNTVLIDNLLFANGVALSKDEEFVLVAESGRSQIHRYYIKGPKQGTTDIFIDGLPGIPDNLNLDGQGGFLVPLVSVRDASIPLPMQILGPFPLLRKLVARIFGLSEFGVSLINQIYPNEYAERAMHLIGHFIVTTFIQPSRLTILHISNTGEIIDSFHANNKKALSISEAYIFNGDLYLGSPFNDFIARIPLSKIGLDHLEEKRPVRDIPTTTPTPIVTPTVTPSSKITSPPTTRQTTKQHSPKTEAPPQQKKETSTQKPITTTPKTTQRPTTQPKPIQETTPPKTTQQTTATPKTTQQTTTRPTTTTPKTSQIVKESPSSTTQPPKPTTQTAKTTAQPIKTTTQAPKPTTQAPKPTTQSPKLTRETPKTTTSQTKPAQQTEIPPSQNQMPK